jgi:hypothetical protein
LFLLCLLTACGGGAGEETSTADPTGTGGTIGTGGGTGTGGTTSSGGNDTGGTPTGGAGTGGAGEDPLSSGGSVDATGGLSSGGSGAFGSGGDVLGDGGSAAGGGDAGTGGSGEVGTGGDSSCGQADTPPAEFLETMEITFAEMDGDFEGMTGARPKSGGIMSSNNSIWDQVLATEGTLNYCIRWESSGTLTTERVAEIERDLEEVANTWFQYLEGYNCWPHGQIPVTVVGVAVAERSRAGWADGAGLPVYVGDMREGAPQCPEACGRWFNRDGDYSSCQGGDANHYDMSLWLTDGFNAAVGGDWGQRMAPESFTLDGMAWMSIHEFGHGLGFPDYYNWEVWTDVPQPVSIMSNSPSGYETEWDAAFMRYVWDRLKER